MLSALIGRGDSGPEWVVWLSISISLLIFSGTTGISMRWSIMGYENIYGDRNSTVTGLGIDSKLKV